MTTVAEQALVVGEVLNALPHLPAPYSSYLCDDQNACLDMVTDAFVGAWAAHFDVPVTVTDRCTFVEVRADVSYGDPAARISIYAHITHARALRLLGREATNPGVQIDPRALSEMDSAAATG